MAGPFPLDDRRDRLFGREPDIAYLTARSSGTQGVTLVVGRPKLGKTWLLQQTADRLATESDALVGYHDCKAETADLLLCAVSDLYTRWLADAGNFAQARSLWARHKGTFTARSGQAVGRLMETLGGRSDWVPKTIGSKIREGFDALSTADDDLKSGGLRLRPLSYDQALELVRIVHAVSGNRPPVLVLDAWEKSPGFGVEKKILDTLLVEPGRLAAVSSICRYPAARPRRRRCRQPGRSTHRRARGVERRRRALRASVDVPRRGRGTGTDAGIRPGSGACRSQRRR